MRSKYSYLPVAVPIAGWLLAMMVIFVVHFISSWRRRKHLVGNLPKIFLWIDPRSFLATAFRQKWNRRTFDRLILEEFQRRNYPPVIAICGPIPWVAPIFASNDATLIAEMLLLGNKTLMKKAGIKEEPPLEPFNQAVFSTTRRVLHTRMKEWEQQSGLMVRSRTRRLAQYFTKRSTSSSFLSEQQHSEVDQENGHISSPVEPCEAHTLREESSRSYSQGEEGGREGGGEEEKGVVLELQRESCALMKTVAHDLVWKADHWMREEDAARTAQGEEGEEEGKEKGREARINVRIVTTDTPASPSSALEGREEGGREGRSEEGRERNTAGASRNDAPVAGAEKAGRRTYSFLHTLSHLFRGPSPPTEPSTPRSLLPTLHVKSTPEHAHQQHPHHHHAPEEALEGSPRTRDGWRTQQIKALVKNDELLGTDYVGPLVLPRPPLHDAVASHALSVLLLVLARVPSYQSRIWAEATLQGIFPSAAVTDESASEGGRLGQREGGNSFFLEGFDHKDLLSLPFTVALLNEVFRLYPPHPTILRRTPCAVTIDLPATLPSPLPASALPSPTPRSLPDGQWRPITPRYTPSFARGTDRGGGSYAPVHTLPPGVNLTLSLLGLHTDDRFYPSASSFVPERWLEQARREEGKEEGGGRQNSFALLSPSSSFMRRLLVRPAEEEKVARKEEKSAPRDQQKRNGLKPPPLSLEAIAEGLEGRREEGTEDEEKGEEDEYQRFVQVKVLTAVLLLVQRYKILRANKRRGQENKGVEKWIQEHLDGRRQWRVRLVPRDDGRV